MRAVGSPGCVNRDTASLVVIVLGCKGSVHRDPASTCWHCRCRRRLLAAERGWLLRDLSFSQVLQRIPSQAGYHRSGICCFSTCSVDDSSRSGNRLPSAVLMLRVWQRALL